VKELSIVAICVDPDVPILERFLSSIRQYCQCDYELIIVDNAGEIASVSSLIKANCDSYIRLTDRVSVARAWNIGIGAATGRYILITNDDVVVSRNWFEQMKSVFLSHDATGMVAPCMNHSVPAQTLAADVTHLDAARPIRLTPFTQFIWGAFMLFTRESLAAVNNFSEEFEIAGGEDLDICFKLFEAKLDIYVDHRVFIYHEWGSTGNRILGPERRRELYEESYRKFKQKWIRYTHDWDQASNKSRSSAFGRWLTSWVASRRRS
jgi:GT2 family glycosyltransferase